MTRRRWGAPTVAVITLGQPAPCRTCGLRMFRGELAYHVSWGVEVACLGCGWPETPARLRYEYRGGPGDARCEGCLASLRRGEVVRVEGRGVVHAVDCGWTAERTG